MSGLHALLATSSAPRWVKCAGSVPLEALYPEMEDSVDAANGTAAHWVAFELFHNRIVCEGLVAPNGVAVTQEMIDCGEMYADHLRLVACFGGTAVLERRVMIPYVHEQNWGTPDAWVYNDQTRILTMIDYKFGHRFVDVFENYQLIDYVCGVLDELGINGATDQMLEVHFYIVQPRSYHRDGPIRLWKTTAAALRGYFNILQAAAQAALSPNPICTVNAECLDCRGRHACEASQRTGFSIMDISTSSVPVIMSAHAIGLELKMLYDAELLIKARKSGLEKQAEIHMMRGEMIPNFMMQPTEGRQEWSKPVAEVIALGSLFGIDVKKDALITPIQAVKAGLDAAAVAGYTMRKRGLTLVIDDGSTARKAFGK